MTYYAVSDKFIAQFDAVRKAQFALAAGLGVVRRVISLPISQLGI